MQHMYQINTNDLK